MNNPVDGYDQQIVLRAVSSLGERIASGGSVGPEEMSQAAFTHFLAETCGHGTRRCRYGAIT